LVHIIKLTYLKLSTIVPIIDQNVCQKLNIGSFELINKFQC